MSAFSRGSLLRRQCAPRISNRIVYTKSCHRLFSSASTLQAGGKAQPSALSKTFSRKPSFTPTKSSPVPTSIPILTPILGESFASSLAKRSRPTILYQAPSHRGFMISCYLAGGFCIAYAVVAFNANYIRTEASPDISWWVPFAFGGVSFIMIAFGTWFLLAPTGVINHIRALPRSVSNVSRPANPLSKANQSELQIEVELKKMFPVPFFPARKLYVKPGEIELPFPLSTSIIRPALRNMKAERTRRLEEEAAKQKALEYERSHIMSSGLRHTGRAFSQVMHALFQGTRRAFWRDGFIKIGVKNKKYKLDVSGGWVLDEGRALDRLSMIKRT